MSDIHAHKILILDFGSQYTQLIARRVREIGVFSEIRAFDITEEEIREYNPNGIILAGGPESVTELDSPPRPAVRIRDGPAGIRYLLRHANHGRAAGRQGRRL